MTRLDNSMLFTSKPAGMYFICNLFVYWPTLPARIHTKLIPGRVFKLVDRIKCEINLKGGRHEQTQ